MGELRQYRRGKDNRAVGRDSREGPILVIFIMQHLLGTAIYLPFIGGKQRKGVGILIKRKSLLLIYRGIKRSSSGDIRVYRQRGLEVNRFRNIEERNSIKR